MFCQLLVVGLMCQSIQAKYWDYMRIFPGAYYTVVQHVRVAPSSFLEAVSAPKQSFQTQDIYSAFASLKNKREIKQDLERTIPYNQWWANTDTRIGIGINFSIKITKNTVIAIFLAITYNCFWEK
ncbi:hypothetical protein PSHT_11049 [Puccinia striiformis]|uniref:Uncharacterized protein n=1 Tax=Puccinia striiformis TaxID=27350 RepID=A0A2S4V5K5_9BASI|nr:hypothetical protein PSHT_11049 [Puccinia striiformis]